jgi:uncharacterized protein (TIGR02453 family)
VARRRVGDDVGRLRVYRRAVVFAYCPGMDDFAGFPVAALDFYDDLEVDNSRSFWASQRSVYEVAVKVPMAALCAALEPEFGEAKIFRPHRDVRFAKDKSPYKTHQGAFVPAGPATGWYVQVSAAGVMVGVGYYDAPAARLAAIRAAIADDRTGPALESMVATLRGDGWQLGGETVKTAPRGYPADHPRIELLRHRSMHVSKSYGFPDEVHTPVLLDWVRRDWSAGRPFVDWMVAHGG